MRELNVTEQDSVTGGCLDLLHSIGVLLNAIPHLPAHCPRESTPPLTISNNYGVIIGQVNGHIGQINGYVGQAKGPINVARTPLALAH